MKPELPWEGECIEAASIIRRNGLLYMFYAGSYDNTPQQIGVATSKDGVKWTRLFDEPFLRNGQPGEWNSSESGHPGIFDDGDRSFLFFPRQPGQGQTLGGFRMWRCFGTRKDRSSSQPSHLAH